MHNWRTHYASKLVTARDAVKAVRSGDRVVLGHACGEPPALVKALAARAAELVNVEVFHVVMMQPCALAKRGMERSFHFNGIFLGPHTREGVAEDRGVGRGRPPVRRRRIDPPPSRRSARPAARGRPI